MKRMISVFMLIIIFLLILLSAGCYIVFIVEVAEIGSLKSQIEVLNENREIKKFQFEQAVEISYLIGYNHGFFKKSVNDSIKIFLLKYYEVQ